MGLDIRIYQMRPVCCPHCGELVTYKTVDAVDGSGSVWYEFLASVGYYKPYVKGQQYNHGNSLPALKREYEIFGVEHVKHGEDAVSRHFDHVALSLGYGRIEFLHLR